MKTNTLLLLLLLPLSLFSQYQPTNFPDLLPLEISTPKSPANPPSYFMADQGSWFGFALPKSIGTTPYASFIGPYSMNENPRWIAKTLAAFHLINADNNQILSCSSQSIHSFPGRLEISMNYNDLMCTVELIFGSDHTALIKSTVINSGEETRRIIIGWKGDLFQNSNHVLVEDHLSITFPDRQEVYTVKVQGDNRIEFPSDSTYLIKSLKPIVLKGKALNICSTLISQYDDSDLASLESLKMEELLWNTSVSFNQYTKRWTGYVSSIATRLTHEADSLKLLPLAVKCIQTLTTNWRTQKQGLPHAGLFPSSFYTGFYGFWAWDSWKQAAALAYFSPNLAKDQIKTMFALADSAGMVPDVIYADPKENNFRNTKPPLAAWAVEKYLNLTSDTAFAREIFPSLVKYHKWWYRHRDNNLNNLCSWGSCDGTSLAATWESGMDKAVRFNNLQMVKSSENSYNFTSESVDLNSWLYIEKIKLSNIASKLGKKSIAQTYATDANQLSKTIIKSFWNKSRGYFFDKTLDGKWIEVYGCEGWLPLYSGICLPDQVDAITKTITSDNLFNTYTPFPSLAKSHPSFDPAKGYWNGPVWIDQAAFAIEGLRNSGKKQLALKYLIQLINSTRMAEKGMPIYENYNPLTGEGLNAQGFSWSAAHILMLLVKP